MSQSPRLCDSADTVAHLPLSHSPGAVQTLQPSDHGRLSAAAGVGVLCGVSRTWITRSADSAAVPPWWPRCPSAAVAQPRSMASWPASDHGRQPTFAVFGVHPGGSRTWTAMFADTADSAAPVAHRPLSHSPGVIASWPASGSWPAQCRSRHCRPPPCQPNMDHMVRGLCRTAATAVTGAHRRLTHCPVPLVSLPPCGHGRRSRLCCLWLARCVSRTWITWAADQCRPAAPVAVAAHRRLTASSGRLGVLAASRTQPAATRSRRCRPPRVSRTWMSWAVDLCATVVSATICRCRHSLGAVVVLAAVAVTAGVGSLPALVPAP